MLLIYLGIAIAMHVLLRYTMLGRSVYAMEDLQSLPAASALT